MAKVQEIQGARVLVVWAGRKLELRSNVAPLVQVAMLEGALQIALANLFRGGPAPRSTAEIEDVLRAAREEAS